MKQSSMYNGESPYNLQIQEFKQTMHKDRTQETHSLTHKYQLSASN